MNKMLDIDYALECVRQECEDIEVYTSLKRYIENLEREVESLNLEIEALEAVPRYHRVKEEDWK
jgi:wobble nucleotide-excising tRNase